MKRKNETPKRKVNKTQKRLRHAPSPPPNNQIASQFERFQQMQMQQFQQFLESQMPTPCPSQNPSPIVFADSPVTNIDVASSSQAAPSTSPPSENTVTNTDEAPSVTNIDVTNTAYSNLDDLMIQSDDESSDNQEYNRPATPPPERSRSVRPGPSKNYFETPITPKERTAAASTYSPTSPSLLEYKKRTLYRIKID